jgi:hypothetical protein
LKFPSNHRHMGRVRRFGHGNGSEETAPAQS